MVAYTPFFFFWTQHIWDKGAGPKAQAGALTNSKKDTKLCAKPYPYGIFRKNAESLTCGLTTEWILESAQSLACALIRRSIPWSGELLIPRSERELRRSEGSGKLIDDPLVEGSNAGSTNKASDLSQSSGGAEKLGRSEGSGMLIGDPLVEGSSASSTDGELWRAENSFLGMRGTQLPMRSSRAENSLLRVRPITSSGEWRTHSSE